MLLLDADMVTGQRSTVISTGLLGLNLLVMIGMVRSAVVGINQALEHARELKILNAQLLLDKHEDKEKFAKVRVGRCFLLL